MRLSETQVRNVCQKILQVLKTEHLIQIKSGEPDVLAKMEEIFIKDLKVEDDINREAEKLLQQYAAKMGSGLDKEKMFQMIKKQLIKDRKVVI